MTFRRFEFEHIEVAIASATDIRAGDLVQANAADGNRAIRMGLGANLRFLGMAEDTNPVASLGDRLTQITVRRRGTVRLKTAAGTYAPWDEVYATSDPQTVSRSASGATLVGYVSPNQSGIAGGPIAGGAGVEIDVILRPNWPVVDV